jgi:hypothetical protein
MDRVYAVVNIDQVFTPAKNFSKIGDLVTVIVQNAFVLAGVLAFILVIGAGFGMIAAAGSGDSKKMESGKKAMTGAVMGLVIIVASFWIIQIIEVMTGKIGWLLPIK